MNGQITINELLVIMKAIRERIHELRDLRDKVSVQERYYGQGDKSVTPLYDVKKVDQKITELELFVLRADAKIKTSNAVTKVDIEANVEELLKPLE